MEFGNNLRKHRQLANFSQEQLAEELSVSRQTISKWENAEICPSTKHIFALAKIFNCNVSALIGEDSTNNDASKPSKNFQKRFSKKCTFLIASLATSFCLISFCIGLLLPSNQTSKLDATKLAVFDELASGFVDSVIREIGDSQTILGYGITCDNTLFIKCDILSHGEPCSAIIYFCEDNGNYSYQCQFLDDPDFLPEGEYYQIT